MSEVKQKPKCSLCKDDMHQHNNIWACIVCDMMKKWPTWF